jgi:uncharacterized SAM-binding protein YcdF (DUF218 family)
MRASGRVRRLVGWLSVAGLAVLVGAVLTLFGVARVLEPESVEEPQADAVVVLAGSPGDRLPAGLELMDAGAASTLVLSAGADSPRGWGQIEHLCDREHSFELICIVPQSDNTRGEAATISRLAEDRGWQSLALVTSSYHLDRATFLFRRCFDGEVLPVAASPASVTWPLVRHELLGAVHARVAVWC